MPEIIICLKNNNTEGHYYYLVYLLYVTNVEQDLFFCLGSKGERSFVLPEGSRFSHWCSYFPGSSTVPSRMCVLLFKLSPQLNRLNSVGVHVLTCTQHHMRLDFKKQSLEDLSNCSLLEETRNTWDLCTDRLYS